MTKVLTGFYDKFYIYSFIFIYIYDDPQDLYDFYLYIYITKVTLGETLASGHYGV